MLKDVTNNDLDDREFTVRLVHRQLDQDPHIEEVRAWPDEQLLDAADAFLSLVSNELDLDDEDGDEPVETETKSGDQDDGNQAVGEVGDAEPEPLTFMSFRDEIREQSRRRGRQLKRMMSGILALSDSKEGPAFAGFKVGDAFKGLDLALKNAGSTNALLHMDLAKLNGATGLGALKGIDLAKLTGTSKIGKTLSKMLADTQAIEKIAIPPMQRYVPDFPPIEPVPYFLPVERPEIRLLKGVGETLEKMHDDQVRIARDQIDVMAQQATLIKDQGVALTALVNDAKGQKWNRRAMLAFTALMTIAAVVAAFIAGGIVRPFGTAALAPIVSPQASGSPATFLAPTP